MMENYNSANANNVSANYISNSCRNAGGQLSNNQSMVMMLPNQNLLPRFNEKGGNLASHQASQQEQSALPQDVSAIKKQALQSEL